MNDFSETILRMFLESPGNLPGPVSVFGDKCFVSRDQFLLSYNSMKTLAKNHVCNHCVIGEKHLKTYLSGPVLIRPGKLP